MFIRCTQTRGRADGQPYTTYRLVETTRVAGRVRQTTLLNLGSHFDVPVDQWATLARRIDELVRGQAALSEVLAPTTEVVAQRCAAQVIAQRSSPAVAATAATTGDAADSRFQDVDLDSVEFLRPRSVGVEQAALWAMRQCGFEDRLAALGLNRAQIAAAVGNIIGRMARPGSELATHGWLQRCSGLGELMGYDFETMALSSLYRASDALFKHRKDLQAHLFAQAQASFGFGQTVTLYDLTNTYFEGVAAGVSKAARGRSKECRSDCPLVTLALVLDGSGFVRGSQVFAGNASEPATLKQMLDGLSATPGAVVVMDAGIATEANLKWLREQGHHYVVVSRLRERCFDPNQASEVVSAGQETIRIHRVIDAQGHVLLYCHSPSREQKDRAIDETKAAAFEAVLTRLQDGLGKPRGTSDVAKIMERIGRAKQRFARAAQHYKVEIAKDATGTKVTAITWSKHIKPGSAAMYPGVYCLRTTLVDQEDAVLWRTYIMQTQLESVFRSLKTDLGLRPVFHRIDRRVEGHLFISVLAYHFVHVLRLQLKDAGITDSWQTLREVMATQQRMTVTLKCRDGRTAHVRRATRPEAPHQSLIDALRLPSYPGPTQRTVI